MMRADAARLDQLRRNLLENALTYTDGPGRVDISAVRLGGAIRVETVTVLSDGFRAVERIRAQPPDFVILSSPGWRARSPEDLPGSGPCDVSLKV